LNTDNIPSINKNQKFNFPKPISAESALQFLIENGLTKEQNTNIKAQNKRQGCHFIPLTLKLQRKFQCRPTGVNYSETKAEVALQSLLNHTSDRILKMQEKVIDVTLLKHHRIRRFNRPRFL